MALMKFAHAHRRRLVAAAARPARDRRKSRPAHWRMVIALNGIAAGAKPSLSMSTRSNRKMPPLGTALLSASDARTRKSCVIPLRRVSPLAVHPHISLPVHRL